MELRLAAFSRNQTGRDATKRGRCQACLTTIRPVTHQMKVTSIIASQSILLLFMVPGCGSGTESAQPFGESGSSQPQQEVAAAPRKQSALTVRMTPDLTAAKKQMTPAQVALGAPVVNGVGMILVPIPPGEFQMGDPLAPSDREKPVHLVTISKPFYLSVHEVTQQQYEDVLGVRPWQGQSDVQVGPEFPATYVSHNDVVEFCLKLSKQEGVEYRLPTEAEWEYACRAGTATAYSFGDDESDIGPYGWNEQNASGVGEKYAHRVGQKLPNQWGLYDMHGNVFEWCLDWYAPYSDEKTTSDPIGPAQGQSRVLRGGAFDSFPLNLDSAERIYAPPIVGSNSFGFRVARAYNVSPTVKSTAVNTSGAASVPNEIVPNSPSAEAAIERAIRRFANKPEGELTENDFEKVTRLFLSDSEITDLTPLTEMTGLTQLVLANNKIADITPLAEMHSLKVLDLSDNQIADITPLAALTELVDCRFSNNQITDVIPLAGMKELKGLMLNKNNITDLTPVLELKELMGLDLFDNPELTKAEIDKLQKALPHCKITDNATK